MRSLPLMLSPAQLTVLAKRMHWPGAVLTPEELKLWKTIKFRVDEMVTAQGEAKLAR